MQTYREITEGCVVVREREKVVHENSLDHTPYPFLVQFKCFIFDFASDRSLIDTFISLSFTGLAVLVCVLSK